VSHSHSHRPPQRRRREPDLATLPADARQRELDQRAKRRARIERRELRLAQGPREVVVRVPGGAGPTKGSTRSGGGPSRWVWEAVARRLAQAALEALR
jgi:hypothetical protein